VQIATYKLPKNLVRVFEKRIAIFAGFYGPRSCLYLAKWPSYVAKGFFSIF
jgi:hypothetical protein